MESQVQVKCLLSASLDLFGTAGSDLGELGESDTSGP